MKICAAQTKPIKGDIQQNIKNHKKLIELALLYQADLIIFPELSLTGYEPELAAELAIFPSETLHSNEFQLISDNNQVTICVGMPTKFGKGICISLLIYQPFTTRLIYSKRFLHPGEEVFFVSGQNLLPILKGDHKLAFSVCHETSVPEHAETAFANGADIYIASVLNSITGVNKDIKRISEISRRYNMISLMANFTGRSGGYDCAGKTSIWNRQGEIIGQLNDTNEGILTIDIESQEVFAKYV